MRRIKARKGWDKYFSLDYVCIHGQRHRERCVDKKTANRLEEQRIKERATGVCSICKKKEQSRIGRSLSFQDVLNQYLEWKKLMKGERSAWRDEYSFKQLSVFFGNTLITNIKRRDVDQYRIQRLKVVKPGTVLRELCCLKRMFNVAINEWELPEVTKNPVGKVGLREAKRLTYLEPFEIELLEKFCYEEKKTEGLVLITALATGLRKGNLLSLRWNDNLNVIDNIKYGEIIEINIPGEQSKNAQPFTTYILDKRLITELKKLRETSPEYLFVNKKTKKPFKDLRHYLKRALREAGILNDNPPDRLQHFCFHSLRHSFASQLTKRGATLQALMAAGNWRTPAMALRYSHLSGQDVQDTLALFSGNDNLILTKSSNLSSNLKGRATGTPYK